MKTANPFAADALRLSVSLALGVSMATTTGIAFAQDDDEGADVSGRVEVTGSRIKRADIEGALPVTVIDRNQIELSGQISVSDLLRSTSFNSFGSFRPQSGSSAQAVAQLDLRGLGANRTLILIDGRRAPVSPVIGQGQDLNAVPLAAVERIEILSDGASAIYGTDAIGGVVNIITRKDFAGAEFMYGMSKPSRPGGDTEEASVIFGGASGNASALFGASMNSTDIVFQAQRPWSTGGASSFSNNLRIPVPRAGVTPDVTNPGTYTLGGFVAHPTFGSVVPGGCDGPGFTVLDPGTADAFCAYDFTFSAADEAAVKNTSLFARGQVQINDIWSAYANASIARVQSFGRYAAVPSSPWPGGAPFLTPTSPNHPGNPTGYNAGNTAGYSATEPYFFTHRFAALGDRDGNIHAHTYDIVVGFQGTLGMFDVDFGYRDTEAKTFDIGINYVVASIAQSAIESGAYNIYDPFGTGGGAYNDQSTLDGMIATIAREATFATREFYGIANFDTPFEMSGGNMGAAVGFEYREEEYADIYDSLSRAGQIVGSAGGSAAGGRDVTALFFEVLLPVMPDLELSVAGRHDDYSDYGSDFSPKVSARWQPMDTLTLRASWGQGFRAPTLDILTQAPSFSAAGTTHPATCDVIGGGAPCTTQVTTYSIANPNLSSEQSEQVALGVAWDATEWFNMTLDYYQIEITDRVASIGINTIVNCLEGTTQNCPPGLTDFSAAPFAPPDASRGLGAAFGAAGDILYGQTGATNLGTVDTNGLTFTGRTNFSFGDWGSLQNYLNLSHVLGYEVDSGADIVGDRGQPATRATLINAWSWGDFEIAWNVNYIGDQPDALAPGTGAPDPLSSWTTHDLQVNYVAPWNGRVTVGVRNVGDKDPVLDPNDPGGRGFNFFLYNGYGRLPYVRYTQTF